MRLAWPFAALACLSATAYVAPKPEAKNPKTPTYAQDVAPVMNRACVECHRPGEVAPFSLVGYANAKKWADMAAHVTTKGTMPPWKATHGFGEFQDENRLTEAERKLIAAWAKAGAPRGDAKKEPKAPTFQKGEWTLGMPDLVLAPSKPFALGADGEDVYRNFVIRTTHDEPMWVTAMDVKPGNKKVVHHVIAFLDPHHAADKLEKATNDGQIGYVGEGGGVGFVPGGALGGWAPGVRARFVPEGTGFLLPPRTNVVIQVHYHKSGKLESDLTRIGLYTTKVKPRREMNLAWVFNFNVNIPPGKDDYRLEQTRPIPVPITVYGAMPHMHLLGREMRAWFELPDGSTRPLVEVKDWDFNWQLTYALKEPLKIPAGSKLRVSARYDNSDGNSRNPNSPPKRVTWGEGTNDEMFLLIANYTVD